METSITSSSRQTVLGFLDELNAGRLDQAFARLSDDATWELIARQSDYPYPSQYTKGSYRRLIVDSAATFPAGLELTIRGVTAEGERVAVEAETLGTTADGKHYNNRYHFLFELRREKICAVREYLDSGYASEVLRPVTKAARA